MNCKRFFLVLSFLSLCLPLSAVQKEWSVENWYSMKKRGKVVGYMSILWKGVSKKKILFSRSLAVYKDDSMVTEVWYSSKTSLIKKFQISVKDGGQKVRMVVSLKWVGKKGKKIGKGTANIYVKGKLLPRHSFPFYFTSKTMIHPFHFLYLSQLKNGVSLSVFFRKGMLEGTWRGDEFKGTMNGRSFVENYKFNKKGEVTIYTAPNRNQFIVGPKKKVLQEYKKALVSQKIHKKK